MTTSDVIVELKSVQDPAYSVPFTVNFSAINYVGDTLSNISPFDFPLIVFRYTTSNRHKR